MTDAGRVHHRATFAVLATAVTAYALLQSLVIPVLPTIQAQLHTTQNTVTWVLTGYLLSASIFTPILGRLGDVWGKERLFVIAIAALVVGCVMSALASSMALMIVGRVIQGVGGGVIPLAFGIIRDEFPAERVPGAVGVIAAITAAGSGLGIVLAGPVVDALDYHWLFWVPAGLLVVAGVAGRMVIPASPVRSSGTVSWAAAALLSSWLVALLLPISEAPDWGWRSTRVVALLALAAVLLAVWVAAEWRARQPLIDMRLMQAPLVWTTNLVALLFGVGMYATFAFLPQFLQAPPSAGYGFDASITQSGLLLLPSSAVMFVFGVATGRLIARFGSKQVLVTGAVGSVLPFVMLVFWRNHPWQVVLAEGVLGAGFGLAFSAMSSLIVEGVRPDQTGVASGMNANIRTIGGSIGAAVISSVIAGTARPDGLPTNAGYTHGFAVMAAAAAAAALATFLVPSPRRSLSRRERAASLPHAELGLVAGGTLVGGEAE